MSEVDGFTKISTITRLTDLQFLETISFENINKLMDIKNNISKMKKISELSILYH
jgi:arylamine N-acetyltransferase